MATRSESARPQDPQTRSAAIQFLRDEMLLKQCELQAQVEYWKRRLESVHRMQMKKGQTSKLSYIYGRYAILLEDKIAMLMQARGVAALNHGFYSALSGSRGRTLT